jgi:ketoreductase RED2
MTSLAEVPVREMADAGPRASGEPRASGDLHGRVVLVTGSSRGIGAATARRFAAAGARVVVNSAGSSTAALALAAELPEAIARQADVSRAEEASALVEAAASAWGRLDTVINCAGFSRMIPFEDLQGADAELWRRCFDVNLMGVWNVTRAAAPLLRRAENASVVNVSSVGASTISGSSIPYSVSKAGAEHLTRLLARALAPEIRVNAVAPGFTRTAITDALPAEYVAAYERRIPVGRGAEPEEIAEGCFQLACAPFATGTTLTLDGGVHVN